MGTISGEFLIIYSEDLNENTICTANSLIKFLEIDEKYSIEARQILINIFEKEIKFKIQNNNTKKFMSIFKIFISIKLFNLIHIVSHPHRIYNNCM
jgi:hypothetical protein